MNSDCPKTNIVVAIRKVAKLETIGKYRESGKLSKDAFVDDRELSLTNSMDSLLGYGSLSRGDGDDLSDIGDDNNSFKIPPFHNP